MTRTRFVRIALRRQHSLEEHAIHLPSELAYAPSRIGRLALVEAALLVIVEVHHLAVVGECQFARQRLANLLPAYHSVLLAA